MPMLKRVWNKLRGRSGCTESDGALDRMRNELRELERAFRDLRNEVADLRHSLDDAPTNEAARTVPVARAASFAAAAEAVSRGEQVQVDAGAQQAQAEEAGAERASDVGELYVDQEDCIACGTCVEYSEQVFVLQDDGRARVATQDGPADAIQAAVEACPTTCIRWR